MIEAQGKQGQFHRNLVKNKCPKCEQTLEVTGKTDTQLFRRCKSCQLSIVDPLSGGEYPEDVCEICD
jgi:tRNA(Ile2) C34 agmatinyltransferase TiaS